MTPTSWISGENFIMRSLMIHTPRHYCVGDKIEKNVMGGTCSVDGEGRRMYRVLVGKPDGKKPLDGPRHRWDIKTDLQEVGYGGKDLIELAQDTDRWQALVNVVMLRFHKMQGIS
jgi:hypothetical protein